MTEPCDCSHCGYPWQHKTLDNYPDKDGEFVGVTILDERPGLTGIYLRTKEGLLWPARTVDRSLPEHHAEVVAAWMQYKGINEDLRTES
jgi:hypothetical protein